MAGGELIDRVLTGASVETTEIVDRIALAAVEVSEGDDSDHERMYGALGVGGRPLDRTGDGAAEAIVMRGSDGLPVIAMHDLRIETALAEQPGKGTTYAAGYYGARLRFDVIDGEA